MIERSVKNLCDSDAVRSLPMLVRRLPSYEGGSQFVSLLSVLMFYFFPG